MKNYYEFTKLIDDKESINYYDSLSNDLLNDIKIILNILKERDNNE